MTVYCVVSGLNRKLNQVIELCNIADTSFKQHNVRILWLIVSWGDSIDLLQCKVSCSSKTNRHVQYLNTKLFIEAAEGQN
jgi:hypothetical protein